MTTRHIADTYLCRECGDFLTPFINAEGKKFTLFFKALLEASPEALREDVQNLFISTIIQKR